MSILSFDEIKSIRDMLREDNKERFLMKVSYLILGVVLYLSVAILFAKYELYSSQPFNLILETEIVSAEIAIRSSTRNE